MNEKINKESLKKADELINRPDKEIMALYLGKNEKYKGNYQMAIAIKLRGSLDKLNLNIESFDKSSKKFSNIMIWLTVILVILTLLLSWQTFMAIFK